MIVIIQYKAPQDLKPSRGIATTSEILDTTPDYHINAENCNLPRINPPRDLVVLSLRPSVVPRRA